MTPFRELLLLEELKQSVIERISELVTEATTGAGTVLGAHEGDDGAGEITVAINRLSGTPSNEKLIEYISANTGYRVVRLLEE